MVLERVKNEQGFSILEIILVAFILSISVTIAVNRLSSLEYFQLKSEAVRLADELRYLQAISRTVYRRNDFNLDKTRSVNNKLVLEKNSYYLVLDSKNQRKYYCGEGISIKSNLQKKEILYKSNGMIANPCTITLEKGKEKLFIVLDVVGRIRISSEDVK